MEEMTNEEKAKRYDESLAKAKDCLKDGTITSTAKSYIEEIFPELAESGDEQMRKKCIELIKELKTFCIRDGQNECIAWLEKKGEQKPMKTCAEYYNNDSELKMPELSVFQNKLADILMQREYEGSTETEEDVASARLDYELAAIRISEELLPLAIMQKPAEWSKDDERIKNILLSELTNLSVRKLIKKETEKKYASWLKSFKDRYTWKPSDEQMETLEGTFVALGGYDDYLKSLINDLKKLREE